MERHVSSLTPWSSLTTRYDVRVEDNLQSHDSWQPIPELSVSDADVSVFFLETNDIVYSTPVVDPWFAAEEGPFSRSTSYGNITYYQSNQPVKALACVQQYQFCNPSLNHNESCTPLMGIFEAARSAPATVFSQSKDIDRFLWSLAAIQNMAGGFTEISMVLRGGSLLASDYVSQFGQDGLPDNQWELELEHWFKFTMADLQRAIVDQATGPVVPEARSFHSPPTSPGARAICSNQKIRSDSYTSFNVLGLILIFSLGSLIMLISACLPTVTARVQRYKNPFASIEWVTSDTLQLQRLAHEAIGAGQWEGACDDYPRTRKGDLLAVIDISDGKHPVLRAPGEIRVPKDVKHAEGQGDEKRVSEEQRKDSAQESLLSVELPRISLELSHRFAAGVC
ncbi:hypothetical protein AA0113_g118 [Alternaria arborescens]|uniref:Uncharacterized protein n=1 Tax=Alternaria arborescens TaxID=156630 RepID=A0A4Q4SRI1_9PLEO|nr:hypothetical protein AA0113_g118 [Alternaria arborescens]